jgi:hypothetical protein
MKHFFSWLCVGMVATMVLAKCGFAQQPLTWQEVRDKFEMANPTLRAGQIGVDESRADEITANLRPIPNLRSLRTVFRSLLTRGIGTPWPASSNHPA